MSIITISREFAAGGQPIARKVAKELGIEIYDRDIIRHAVKSSGLDASTVEQEEEEISRTDAILRMITPAAYVDRQDTIHEIERRFILTVARRGDCVILGRCADAILEEANIESLNVFLYADDIHRAVRASQLIDSKNASEIKRALRRTDAARRSYYQEFTTRRWGDYHNYNLSLDTGLLGYETCVKIICEASRNLNSSNELGV